MRLAFVDTEFSWPPPGGAQVDLYNTMRELQALGHDVHLFCSPDARLWRFGDVDASKFDLPFTQLNLGVKPFDMEQAAEAYHAAISAWQADVVFLCFGFYLKPYLAERLRDIPVVSRYYTYEMICIRDFFLFKDYDTCPHGYLATPNVCRDCFVRSWRHGIRRSELSEFAEEFLYVGGMSQAFYDRYVEHIRSLDAIVVSNEMTKARLAPYNSNVHVLPGGVHVNEFQYSPVPQKGRQDKKFIFMAGRADDPLKGLHTLVRAGEILAKERDDFEIWVTSADPHKKRPWLRLLGWCDLPTVRRLYTESDICVVPSLWDEPFGLVAVEAMATGRPVVVSRVGGLQHIPIPEETGLVHDRKDYAELADHLRRLLDDYDLRRRMGDAGRRRAESEFDWRVIVSRYYPSMLEEITR